jgi:hypothetical protein
MKNLKSELENKNAIAKRLEDQISTLHSDLRESQSAILSKYFKESDEVKYAFRYWGVNVTIPSLYDHHNSMEIKFYEKYVEENGVNLIDDIKICLNGSSFGNEDEVINVLNHKIEVTNILKENRTKIIKGLNTQTIAFSKNIEVLRDKLKIVKKDREEIQKEYDTLLEAKILYDLKEGYVYGTDEHDNFPFIQINATQMWHRVSGIRLVDESKSGKTCQIAITQIQRSAGIIEENETILKTKVSSLISFVKENEEYRKTSA